MINWPEINTFNDAIRLIAHLAKPWLGAGILYIIWAFLWRWKCKGWEAK